MMRKWPVVQALLTAGVAIFVLAIGPAQAGWEIFTGTHTEKASLQDNTPAPANNNTKVSGESSALMTGQGQESADRRLPPTVQPTNLQRPVEREESLFSMGAASLPPSVGLPLVLNDAVDRYIHYFSITKKELFKKWLRRKSLYEPMIKQVLQEHGLPEDLVYLAMIESGFNLQACSPMKAAGPWQFIPETGRRYGLTVNYWVDERRDIEKSTVAAARYLSELFNQFDCWHLAAAAYNTGEHRIDKLIKRHDTKDFWELRGYNGLPRETREYVPQLIAAAIIAKNPEKYGFTNVELAAPLEYVGEEVPGGIPLKAVAQAASTDLSSVLSLNPELRRGITPPGRECRIKLPAGTDSDTFQNSLSSILEKGKRVVGVVRHLISKKDNVSKITQRYGVSEDDLFLVNGSQVKWKKGSSVYIPKFSDTDGDEEPALGKTADFKGEPIEDIASDVTSGRKAKAKGLKKTRMAHGKQKAGARVASQVKKSPRNAAKKQHSSGRRTALRHR
jgi:membrane-bound lytic murein transglycosylase D